MRRKSVPVSGGVVGGQTPVAPSFVVRTACERVDCREVPATIQSSGPPMIIGERSPRSSRMSASSGCDPCATLLLLLLLLLPRGDLCNEDPSRSASYYERDSPCKAAEGRDFALAPARRIHHDAADTRSPCASNRVEGASCLREGVAFL
ncbi:hypothetical protein HPB50_025455 [Hyalomma asiaticum]|uniref:Uncharacterized protein n=1 Tax=Hyalomma asiaticum TaxID=266040 RepID=A0ACB7RQP8_HYAAI|nr:hypothetical protein HPB50_025455 [Hyalomma asiaticum]